VLYGVFAAAPHAIRARLALSRLAWRWSCARWSLQAKPAELLACVTEGHGAGAEKPQRAAAPRSEEIEGEPGR